MNNPNICMFSSAEFGDLRVVRDENGTPWFVGREVCEKLGYTDANHTILDHVDPEDRVNSKTQGQNDPEFGQRGTWLVNESGLYSLVLGSKLESAKRFKRWITSEVLPTIRKHGMYVEPQKLTELLQKPESIVTVLETLLKEQQERMRLEAQIEADAPATKFGKQLQASDGTICLREMWKILKDHGCTIKHPAFFKRLREEGLIYKDSTQPTVKAQDLGIIECKTSMTADGKKDTIRLSGVVTTKGIQYFLAMFLNQ